MVLTEQLIRQDTEIEVTKVGGVRTKSTSYMLGDRRYITDEMSVELSEELLTLNLRRKRRDPEKEEDW